MSTPTDITIQSNASFALVLELKDSLGVAIDLSGITLTDIFGQIREKANTPKLADFGVELYTDGTDGKVKLTLTYTQTSSLPMKTLQYDAFWTVDANTRHRLVYGEVTMEDNISK